MQQLFSFMKCYNKDKEETETKFVYTADLLAESEEQMRIFKRLKNLFRKG